MTRDNRDGVVRDVFGHCAHLSCQADLSIGEWHTPECPHHLPVAEPPATVRVPRPVAACDWGLS